jgi:hypothetical protein
MAIREISNHDQAEICRPIVLALLDKLNGGIWVGEFDWGNGRWMNNELGAGTIYINVKPGFIWNNDGTLDRNQLRETLTEEGIHLYFDTDVGHNSGDTPEQREAMETMRQVCGYN